MSQSVAAQPVGRASCRLSLKPHSTSAIYVDPTGSEYVVAQIDHQDGTRMMEEAGMTFLVGHLSDILKVERAEIAGWKTPYRLLAHSRTISAFQEVARHGARVCSEKVFQEKVLKGKVMGGVS